jgi:cytoskeletal protein CcmA (bactofilin family)
VNDTATFDQDVTLNQRLQVNNVSVNQQLVVAGTTILVDEVTIRGHTTVDNSLYVTGQSKHGSLECNTSTVLNGTLSVAQLTTLNNVQGNNASFQNLLISQNVSFENNLFVRADLNMNGNMVVDGNLECRRTGKFTTLVYDTLESTNTSTVNQVVNQLKVKNFYPPPDDPNPTGVPGYLELYVPTTITRDLSSNNLNGLTFQQGTQLVMNQNTDLNVYGNLTVKSGATVAFESGTTVEFNASTTTFQNITLNGRIITTSDRKLKTNIHPLRDTLNQVKDIHGHRYQRIDQETERIQIGLIAQEVEETYPELVFEEDGTKRVDYISFIAVLLGCIQELESRVILLESKK